MNILRTYNVPTGKIIVLQGSQGSMEVLSIGDYGKENNIKADFLDMPDEIKGVRSEVCMPLEEKWVITMSTQFGCSMGCTFCDVPRVGPGYNCSERDLEDQFIAALNAHDTVRHTKRLNIHFARMGEPTFNPAVLLFVHNIPRILKDHGVECDTIHPVLTTMFPKVNAKLGEYLTYWVDHVKNGLYIGEAGLQLSINSTNDEQRAEMFGDCALTLEEIADLCDELPAPIGRKYALNFALADGYIVDGGVLSALFDPAKFMVKITPIHITTSTEENGIITTGGYDDYYPYKEAEASCKEWGFDVLVFVPSRDEDDSLITCGNAVLAGREPLLASRTPKLRGIDTRGQTHYL